MNSGTLNYFLFSDNTLNSLMEKLDFKKFLTESSQPNDWEVTMLYYGQQNMKVKDIAKKTGRSIGEIYRILAQNGGPNRQTVNHSNVLMFSQSGLPNNMIAGLTGYTPRNVRYVLKNKGTR